MEQVHLVGGTTCRMFDHGLLSTILERVWQGRLNSRLGLSWQSSVVVLLRS